MYQWLPRSGVEAGGLGSCFLSLSLSLSISLPPFLLLFSHSPSLARALLLVIFLVVDLSLSLAFLSLSALSSLVYPPCILAILFNYVYIYSGVDLPQFT